MEIRSLGVVGAGQMGNGIAHTAAAAGCSVVLVDVEERFLQAARATIEKNLEREVGKGTRTAEEKAGALARLTTSTALESLASADAVRWPAPRRAIRACPGESCGTARCRPAAPHRRSRCAPK